MHQTKFLKSIHLVKFFDIFLKLLEDFNAKMQIEALQLLKIDLRGVFKVYQSNTRIYQKDYFPSCWSLSSSFREATTLKSNY